MQFTHASFNYENSLINATHAINHLSFGTPLPKSTRLWIEYMESNLEHQSGAHHPHALFFDSMESLDDTVFISDHVDRTYEHFIQVKHMSFVFKNDGFCIQNDAFCIQTDGFIQVIPTIYRSRRGLTVKTYKYSVTSAEHTDTDKFPSAKFTYQISPMAVVMTEKGEPLYEFLTRLCAIVGGL